MLTTPGGTAELYGWEHLRTRTDRLVVCEGEFDRLVLEGRGIAAVTSTAGASTFRMEWADALRGVSQLFVCFDRDAAGSKGRRECLGYCRTLACYACPMMWETAEM